MAATRQDIECWLQQGVASNSTHVVIFCDTFDWEDYPVYVQRGQDVLKVIEEHKKENHMDKVMEVYNLSLDIQSQLAEYRAYHL